MKVKVIDVTKGRKLVGFLSDEGGEPKGSTPAVDALLGTSKKGRAETFAKLAQGYSNGYYAYEPES